MNRWFVAGIVLLFVGLLVWLGAELASGNPFPQPKPVVPVTTTTVPPTTTTTVPPTTTTTIPPPPPTTTTAPVGNTRYGCAAALAYLHEYANPSFTDVCPGYAYGYESMTCNNHPPECGVGQAIIVIADPCPAAYMNEAYNSQHGGAQIDPYGDCEDPRGAAA